MSNEHLDSDGYPTEETLKAIEAWPWQDIPGVFKLIRELWWCDGWGVSDTLSPAEKTVCHDWNYKNSNYLRFATGGWSGNESLIYALRANHIIWSVTWVLSARGGLHIFRLRDDGLSL
jgi:hypothetical protein